MLTLLLDKRIGTMTVLPELFTRSLKLEATATKYTYLYKLVVPTPVLAEEKQFTEEHLTLGYNNPRSYNRIP